MCSTVLWVCTICQNWLPELPYNIECVSTYKKHWSTIPGVGNSTTPLPTLCKTLKKLWCGVDGEVKNKTFVSNKGSNFFCEVIQKLPFQEFGSVNPKPLKWPHANTFFSNILASEKPIRMELYTHLAIEMRNFMNKHKLRFEYPNLKIFKAKLSKYKKNGTSRCTSQKRTQQWIISCEPCI